ncbi:hypothetical protein [Metabacillus fastidiosus]|uniref:hypothetical protein n=1 Tax=Metabacillus fastidiosus TaxID=1458 RepID=UPI003D2AE0F0
MNMGLEIIVLLLLCVGVRAFLFEIKFEYTRHKLRNKHELFEIFLDCPFCNGFWTGLFGYIIVVGLDFVTLPFAILVGTSSYYLKLFTKNLK